MARSSDSKELNLFARPALLITESEEEFASLSAALEQAIQPRDVVERMYVDDIATLVWEILRWRRCKTAIVNTAFHSALSSLVNDLAGFTYADTPENEERAALISDWFSEPEAKKEISELLAEYHLDELAIEAKAMQRVSSDLELFDRMLTSAESRRNKALRSIADYRQILSKQLQQASDRILDNDDMPRLVAVGRRPK